MYEFKTLNFVYLFGLIRGKYLVTYIFQRTNVTMNFRSHCMPLQVEVSQILPSSGFRNLVGKHEVGFLGGGIDPASFHYDTGQYRHKKKHRPYRSSGGNKNVKPVLQCWKLYTC